MSENTKAWLKGALNAGISGLASTVGPCRLRCDAKTVQHPLPGARQ